jgi:hypothetical protein
LPAQLPPSIDRALGLARVDFGPVHRQPSAARVVAASVISVAGSLAADAVLVAIGTAVFPSTRGFIHFRFSDYAKLTVIGVVIACLAWPVVTRISSEPRWLFLRMAVLVTLVLGLPDLYILAKGEPLRAVAVLMVMHLAIALVTYNCLVRIARVEATGVARRPASGRHRNASRMCRPPRDDGLVTRPPAPPLFAGDSRWRPLAAGSAVAGVRYPAAGCGLLLRHCPGQRNALLVRSRPWLNDPFAP